MAAPFTIQSELEIDVEYFQQQLTSIVNGASSSAGTGGRRPAMGTNAPKKMVGGSGHACLLQEK